MVVGARQSEVSRPTALATVLGNIVLLTGLLARMFGRSFSDISVGLSGCSRAASSRAFPVLSAGFEIETEISVHALELAMPIADVMTRYGARPEGSTSKLSTYRDGWRILRTMITLYRSERPTIYYGIVALVLAVAAFLLAVPLLVTYWQTGLVPRFPTAILIMGLLTIAVICVFVGFILDTVTKGRREMKRLAYLSVPAPRA
jgi:hypothetical protein